MKSLIMLTAVALSLAGCGGGGSGGGSTPPLGPPPPPPVTYEQYDGVVTNHSGSFASQGSISIQYTPDTDTLVFPTVIGWVTVGPSRHVTINSVDYVANFSTSAHVLIFGAVVNSNDYASWTITLVAANG